jgi:hypothetical protein
MSTLPLSPHHCLWTPTVFSPFFAWLVSSMTPMALGSAWSRTTIVRTRCLIRSALHRWIDMNSCSVRTGTPASNAIGSMLLR